MNNPRVIGSINYRTSDKADNNTVDRNAPRTISKIATKISLFMLCRGYRSTK